MVARPLLSLRLYLCASTEYVQRAGMPKHPVDLSRHNCLNVPAAVPDGIWHFVRGKARAKVAVRGSVKTNTVEALHDLVLGGTGITLLPGYMAHKEIREGKLMPLLPDWEIETRANLYAVYLPTRHLALKVRVFIDFRVERLGDTPRRQSPAA